MIKTSPLITLFTIIGNTIGSSLIVSVMNIFFSALAVTKLSNSNPSTSLTNCCFSELFSGGKLENKLFFFWFDIIATFSFGLSTPIGFSGLEKL